MPTFSPHALGSCARSFSHRLELWNSVRSEAIRREWRFAIRFDLSDYRDPVRIERDLMQIMPVKEWWMFNHRLVHYGRDYCPARRHDCAAHPLTKVYPKAASVWPRSK